MQEIIDVSNNLAGSMFERFPQQIYAAILFVLWCGLGLVGVVVARKQSAHLQEQINELRRDLRQLEQEEGRRTAEAIRLRSGNQVHEEDASSIAPFSIITMPAPPLHAAPTSHQEPRE